MERRLRAAFCFKRRAAIARKTRLKADVLGVGVVGDEEGVAQAHRRARYGRRSARRLSYVTPRTEAAGTRPSRHFSRAATPPEKPYPESLSIRLFGIRHTHGPLLAQMHSKRQMHRGTSWPNSFPPISSAT